MRLRNGRGVRGEESTYYGANDSAGSDFVENDSRDPNATEAAAYNRRRLAIAQGKKKAYGAQTEKTNKAKNNYYKTLPPEMHRETILREEGPKKKRRR